MTYKQAIELKEKLTDEEKFCKELNRPYKILVTPENVKDYEEYWREIYFPFFNTNVSDDYYGDTAKKYSSDGQFSLRGVVFADIGGHTRVENTYVYR